MAPPREQSGVSRVFFHYMDRGVAMIRDSVVRRLLSFSLRHSRCEAIAAFPMFEVWQIVDLYDRTTVSERRRLLRTRPDVKLLHVVCQYKDHRNPAQSEKLREQATDPSNR